MPTASQRLLSLLSLLQTPRVWAGSEIAERLDVSPRTIRRDIDRLRELGYPVDAIQGGQGGYRLVSGAAMPPLALDDEEAVAVAVGLRLAATHPLKTNDDAAVRALAKLVQVLPARLRRRVDNVAGAITAHPFPASAGAVDPDALVTLAAAIANHERLRFSYRRPGRSPERRHVEPHALVAASRSWQLLAFDLDRDDWRTFRLDRATSISEIAAQADVGFGSFYNHFASKEDIAQAILAETIHAQGATLQALTTNMEDPAKIVALAHRYFVRRAASDPSWGWLLVRLDASHNVVSEALGTFALNDLKRGVEQGRFDLTDLTVTLHAIGGALLGVMRAVLDGVAPADADVRHAEGILRLLGLDRHEASSVALAAIPPDLPLWSR